VVNIVTFVDKSRTFNIRNYLDFYQTNISMVIKSRRIRWIGNVARIGELRSSY